jgi:hypothetical protein
MQDLPELDCAPYQWRSNQDFRLFARASRMNLLELPEAAVWDKRREFSKDE